MKPEKLYHGSGQKVNILNPTLVQAGADQVHTRAAVFATERKDVAAIFMFPLNTLHSIGLEKDIAYICIWGDASEFSEKDSGGYVYELPSGSFEKMGKEYEWQSFDSVRLSKIDHYESVIKGMMECGVQVYFIKNDSVFDQIVAQKNERASILKDLISENEKLGINIKKFN